MKRGNFVQTWFDTGAMGMTILYGVVIAAGPVCFRVRWESGRTNRIRQDAPGDVRLAKDIDEQARLRLGSNS